jgi:hypothetical protein
MLLAHCSIIPAILSRFEAPKGPAKLRALDDFKGERISEETANRNVAEHTNFNAASWLHRAIALRRTVYLTEL